MNVQVLRMTFGKLMNELISEKANINSFYIHVTSSFPIKKHFKSHILQTEYTNGDRLFLVSATEKYLDDLMNHDHFIAYRSYLVSNLNSKL